MSIVKQFGLTALIALVAMAVVGATSALATSTQLCKVHTSLTCEAGNAQTHVHNVLKAGTVYKILNSFLSILCLGALTESTPLGLATNGPQVVHVLELTFSGCGTGSGHSNCTITTEEQPLAHLLKTGLDQGVLLFLSGRLRLVCSNIGINCVYDLEGMEFAAGANHLTAEETPTTELGGKFFCLNEGFWDFDLEGLLPTYILG